MRLEIQIELDELVKTPGALGTVLMRMSTWANAEEIKMRSHKNDTEKVESIEYAGVLIGHYRVAQVFGDEIRFQPEYLLPEHGWIQLRDFDTLDEAEKLAQKWRSSNDVRIVQIGTSKTILVQYGKI